MSRWTSLHALDRALVFGDGTILALPSRRVNAALAHSPGAAGSRIGYKWSDARRSDPRDHVRADA
jgi:hypothetical protein